MGARRLLAFVPVVILAGAAGADPPAAGAQRVSSSAQDGTPPPAGWPQWGGPRRDFIVESGALSESWPAGGPPVRWSRPLGTGHSAIVADESRLYTLYRAGDGRARRGPWAAEESVIAMDAKTGRTLWEHTYPSRREDFSFGAGPHATPLIVGERLFTIGTNKQLFAFDKRSGRVLWSHDLIAEFNAPELLIRPVVKTGYGCSPIAFRDTILCSVGGPGQSVMAFRQSDGAVVWKSGDFLISEAPPLLIEVAGRPQVVFVGGGTITGLDPATGRILWSHPHDPGNDLNCSTPLWGPDDILVVSSAYKAGSRAIRLRTDGAATLPEELWFTSRVRFMFLNAIRLGEFVYGTTGDFGPAFLTALDVRTGQAAWQHRGFGRSSLVYADGKAIVMDEDGDLALVRLTPDGPTVLAEARIFETTSWTVPTLVGTTLYARDREKVVALELGAGGAGGPTGARGSVRFAGAAGSAGTAGAAGSAGAPALSAAPGAGPSSPPAAALGGTWQLDRAASRVDDAAGLIGLIAAGAPPMLHVTQPANGTLVVESPINEGHARWYRPGASTVTPAGSGGTITMTAQWDGAALTSQGTALAASGTARGVKERYAVSRDGQTLSVDITIAGPEERVSALRYVRIHDVGPCARWPTPCKRLP